MCLESLIYADKLKPPAQVQLHLLSQRCKNSSKPNTRKQPACKVLHANFPNLRVFSRVFLHIFFTQVFHVCFPRGICMQYGGFPRMKHACNAAMPMACTVA